MNTRRHGRALPSPARGHIIQPLRRFRLSLTLAAALLIFQMFPGMNPYGPVIQQVYAASSSGASAGALTDAQRDDKGAILVDSVDRDKPGWRLIFEDHFDGDDLDETKWNRLPLSGTVAPRRDGHWAHSEAFLDGRGHLVIQTREKDGQYYSGAINTLGKFEHAQGYYEIRAQLPKEEGFWTAFWIMAEGVHHVGNDGRDGTEIDIYESPFAKSDRIQHALHWDGYGAHHRSAGHAVHVPGIYDGFHLFALEWNDDEYIFYIDGKETWRTAAGGVSQVPSFMKITAEVGDWAGDIGKARLPAQLLVDYVRVYERIKKVAITSPAPGATVASGTRLHWSIDPDVNVTYFQVEQNGETLYAAPRIPLYVALHAPVHQDGDIHTVKITATDDKGQHHHDQIRLRVRRVHLNVPTESVTYWRGPVEIDADVAFPPTQGQPQQFSWSLQTIRDGEPAETTVLYAGPEHLSPLAIDTLAFDDGAYDLRLTVTSDQGVEASDVRRIVVDNWAELTETFNPPASFFGAAFESLKTVQRSDNWLFLADNADDFFGDSKRLGADGGDAFLMWEHPRWESFSMTVYVTGDEALTGLHLFAADDDVWDNAVPVTPTVKKEPTAPSGWTRYTLSGQLRDASGEATPRQFFMLKVDPGVDDHQLQLGSLSLTGRIVP